MTKTTDYTQDDTQAIMALLESMMPPTFSHAAKGLVKAIFDATARDIRLSDGAVHILAHHLGVSDQELDLLFSFVEEQIVRSSARVRMLNEHALRLSPQACSD